MALLYKTPLVAAAGLALVAALAAPAHSAQEQIAIRSGGIGLEERAALEAQRDRYNLRIAFAEANGDYISDVEVRLSAEARGTVHYAGETRGPFLFARLEPGRYRLEATYAGQTQVRSLTVGPEQPQPYIYVRWPDAAAGSGGRG